MQWNAKMVMADCEECEGSGCTTYLHRDSREWGPDFRERACEACDGTGRVPHRCPTCGETHQEACCPVCEGCEGCCTCPRCYGCEEPLPEGDPGATREGEVYCARCLRELWKEER